MLFDKIAELNYLAVLVAGLVAFFLGALWYMPLFGKQWVRLNGYTEEKVKEMQAKLSPPIFFGGMIVSYVITAFVVALLARTLSVTEYGDAVVLAVGLWIVAAAFRMTGQLASDKHIGIYAIDVGFCLVYLVAIAFLITLWR